MSGCCGPKSFWGPFLSLIATLNLITSLVIPWYFDFKVSSAKVDDDDFSVKTVETTPMTETGFAALPQLMNFVFSAPPEALVESSEPLSTDVSFLEQKDSQLERHIYYLNTKTDIFSWRKYFCHVYYDGYSPERNIFFCPFEGSTRWTEDCPIDNHDCSLMKQIYKASFVILLTSTLLSLLSTCLFFVRSCSSRVPNSKAHGFITLLGFFGTCAALIVFYSNHSRAFEEAFSGDQICTYLGNGPCDSLMGGVVSQYNTQYAHVTQARLWVPLGSFSVFSAFIPTLIAFMFLTMRIPPTPSTNERYTEPLQMAPTDQSRGYYQGAINSQSQSESQSLLQPQPQQQANVYSPVNSYHPYSPPTNRGYQAVSANYV